MIKQKIGRVISIINKNKINNEITIIIIIEKKSRLINYNKKTKKENRIVIVAGVIINRKINLNKNQVYIIKEFRIRKIKNIIKCRMKSV